MNKIDDANGVSITIRDNAPRTHAAVAARVLKACAELVEVGARKRPPLLPLVAEATEIKNCNL